MRGGFDLVKVSYAALPWLLDQYQLLPCGGALGRGCGPLVLARERRWTSLAGRSVAVPGDRTTAYLLMRLWSAPAPPAAVSVVPFAEIMPAVAAGRFDAGLVIHEARFTYPRYGLRASSTSASGGRRDTGLPIPLGAILARTGAVDPDAGHRRGYGRRCGTPGPTRPRPATTCWRTRRRWSARWSTSTSAST